MKEAFLNHTINFITDNQKDMSSEDKEKLAYGLEGIYMNVTKLAVIFTIAIILGFIKEFLIALVLFNIIRYPAFGFHASKSLVCLFSSTVLILGLPYLFVKYEINLTVKIVLCIISVVTYLMYAPADTEKRPLTNKRKRIIRKVFSCSLALIYSACVILLEGHYLSSLFLAALLIEAILISPIIYKIFGESYNNYKKV